MNKKSPRNMIVKFTWKWMFTAILFILPATLLPGQSRVEMDFEAQSPAYNFKPILDNALEPDEHKRELVLQALDDFRMAFNNQDAAHLGKIFDRGAIIVSGTPVDSSLIFLRYDADAYVARMRDVIFARNDTVDLLFEDIKIFRHPDLPEIYGAVMYQKWNTSTYSDEGFLYLTFDLRGENPLIMVRYWQENEFEIGRFRDAGMLQGDEELHSQMADVEDLYGQKRFIVNTGSLDYLVQTTTGQEVSGGFTPDSTLHLRLVSGTYILVLQKEGYYTKQLTFEIKAGISGQRNVTLEKSRSPEAGKARKSFLARNKYWIIAGGTALIVGSAAVFRGKKSSQKGDYLPIPPGRPF